MKKLSLFLLVAAALGACRKKDDVAPVDSQTGFLTAKNWRETAETTTTVINGGAATTEDTYAALSACKRDDFAKFNTDNSYVGDEGPTKCSTSAPQTQVGKWSFNSDRTKLTLTDPTNPNTNKTFDLVELSATTMRLRESGTFTSGGITVTATSETTLTAF